MTKVRLPHGSLTTILHPIRNREGGNETRTSHGGTRGATTGTGTGGAQARKKKRDSCESGGGDCSGVTTAAGTCWARAETGGEGNAASPGPRSGMGHASLAVVPG